MNHESQPNRPQDFTTPEFATPAGDGEQSELEQQLLRHGGAESKAGRLLFQEFPKRHSSTTPLTHRPIKKLTHETHTGT